MIIYYFWYIDDITLSLVHLLVSKMIYKILHYNLDSDISNQTMVGIILSTLSSIISYFIAMQLRVKFFNKRIFYHHPFIDIMGIILGSFSVILITYIITIINKKIHK